MCGLISSFDLAEHPVLETIYRFKQRLCYLLLKKAPHPQTT